MHYRLLLVSAALLLPLHGCTTESGADTDTDTDTGTGATSSSTGMGPTTAPPTGGSSSSTGADASDEGGSSSTGGMGESSSSGGEDESSTGSAGENVCYGYALLGFRNEIATDGTAMGQPTCTTEPAPCDGDVVGEWTLEESCGWEILPNFFEELCPGSTQQITASTISGTRTFADDGTFSFDTVTQLDADLQVDTMACAGVDCETFAAGLSEEPGLEMVCEPDGEACNCLYTLDIPETVTGTWDIFMDALLLTSDDGEVLGMNAYCVESGRLSMWTPMYDAVEFPDISCSVDEDCEGMVEGEFDGVGCDVPTSGR